MLRQTIKAVVNKGESHYVAGRLEISVVTQGVTLDETLANLQEAIALYLEGEDLEELGLVERPGIKLYNIQDRFERSL